VAKFGIAYLIARFFTDSKLTSVIVVLMIFLGAFAIESTPREDNPQIVVPGATVVIDYPGATAEEIEKLVVRPVERLLKLIPGIEDYYSTALHSRAEFSVLFKVTEDQEEALVRLHDRFEMISNELPLSSSKPVINSINIADVPVITITIASSEVSEKRLKMLAEDLLDDILVIDDVSSAYIKGGGSDDVIVEVDPAKILSSKVGLQELAAVVRNASASLPLGLKAVGGVNRLYVFDGGLRSLAEVESVAVRASPDGREILLRDIASVTRKTERWRETISLFAFGAGADDKFQFAPEFMPAVTVAISKKDGANSVQVSELVREKLNLFQAKYKSENIFSEVTRDDGAVARETARELFYHLAIAVSVIFVITYAFLGIRAACVVGFTVPLVLAVTLFVISVMGLTLNRLSLLALIIALGMLVDDAIVVLENIYSAMGRNVGERNKKKTVIDAASEVGNPTNIATLALVVVFLSTLIVSGMPGEFFYPISIVVPVAMMASLFVAYSVVPWLAFNFLDFSTHYVPIERYSEKINATYKRAIVRLLDERKARYKYLAIALLMLISALFMPAWQFIRPSGVGGEPPPLGVLIHSMPQLDTNTLNLVIEIPHNKTLMYSHEISQDIAVELAKNKYIDNFQIWLGESGVDDFNSILRGTNSLEGSHIAEIRVNLVDKKVRASTSMDIARDLRAMFFDNREKFGGVLVKVVENPPGPPTRAGILAEIYGEDNEELRKIALGLREVAKNAWGIVEISDSISADIYSYRYEIHEKALTRFGINRNELYSVLDLVINGGELGRIMSAGGYEERRILLRYPFSHVDSLVPLENIMLKSPEGAEVPLSELVSLGTTKISQPIFHKNGLPVAYVMGEVDKSVPLYGVLDVNNYIIENGIGNNYVVNSDGAISVRERDKGFVGELLWDGSYSQVLQAFGEMALALLVSLVMVYFLLVYYYKSFVIPVIAMLAIPFSLIGVFPAHWMFSELFTSTSMIGIIAIAGVVVRNSLLIFDFVFESLRDGQELKPALLNCTVSRLRPIVLTAASIFLGSAVLIKDPLFSGLGLSLVFGTVSSTVMSLFLTPVVLYFYLKRQGNQGERM